MQINARLTHANHLGMAEQAFYVRKMPFLSMLNITGMDADDGKYAFIARCQIYSHSACVDIKPDDDHTFDPGIQGTLDHFIPVLIEFRGIEMCMCIDQQGMYVY